MSEDPDPEAAYAEAQERIKAWREGEELDLSISGLVRIPPEIRELTKLQKLTFWKLGRLKCLLLQDLSPLSGLSALRSLNCSRTQVSDLSPLSGLSALTDLYCSNTQVSDLARLSGLSALTSLSCSSTQVSDLSPLSGLSALTSLSCSSTQVSDLSPLSGLSVLRSLDCSHTQVSDLSPLSGLSALTDLYCSHTQVSDLSPLSGLSVLTNLYCSDTRVSDLTPLSGLSVLTNLYCSDTRVSDLARLSGLSVLTRLNCSRTQVSDLSPLSGLSALTDLDCSSTNVTDLSLLEGFTKLERLKIIDLKITHPPVPEFWLQERLELVWLDCNDFPDLPAELQTGLNCLPALRAHFADLLAGAERLKEARLLILGNGRIGKTQLRRRLCGEAYDERVPSTHGIVVSHQKASGRKGAKLHLWDFGGQEIYHGVHALFLRSRAVFLLGWTPEAEAAPEHAHEGLTFVNHPLPYWIAQIKALAGPQSPLLIVQTQCDAPQDRRDLPEAARLAAEAFPHREFLNFSAVGKGRGLDSLRAALAEAYDAIPKPLIGKGRAAVKREIEDRIAADAKRAERGEAKLHRTMTRAEFERLCAETGGISDPAIFLSFLDAAGVVVAREGLFNGEILLDQNWALDAIYAPFEHSSATYQALLDAGGRFRRRKLGALLWDRQRHAPEDQQFFIGMMRSCSVCFRHDGEGEEAVYVAPDLLPEEIPPPVRQLWSRDAPTEERLFAYPISPSFVMRGLICAVGEQAGALGEYWRGGLHLHDERRRSSARADLASGQNEEGGRIRLRAVGPQAAELLSWLTQILMEAETRSGLRSAPLERPRARPRLEPEAEIAPPQFRRDPRVKPEIYVSYAWNEKDGGGPDREAKVEEFCALARAKGYDVIRDKERVLSGASISAFMKRLIEADRVAIFLSHAYLESAFCMEELHGVWRKAGGEDGEAFWRRARVWSLDADAAKIRNWEGRVGYVEYWEGKLAGVEAVSTKTFLNLAQRDQERAKATKSFAHETGKIIEAIADRVRPASLAELLHDADMEAFLRLGAPEL